MADINEAHKMTDDDLKAKVRHYAEFAIDAQSACNLSGIAHSLSEAITYVRAWLDREAKRKKGKDWYASTEEVNRHPIVVLFVAHMFYLSGLGSDYDFDYYFKATQACDKLKKGDFSDDETHTGGSGSDSQGVVAGESSN